MLNVTVNGFFFGIGPSHQEAQSLDGLFLLATPRLTGPRLKPTDSTSACLVFRRFQFHSSSDSFKTFPCSRPVLN